MNSKPILVNTDVAVTFIVSCRGQDRTTDTMKAARDHIYYLAKSDKLTRHGEPKRGAALWDLRELAKPYTNTTLAI